VDRIFPDAGVAGFPPEKFDDLMKVSPFIALAGLLTLAFTLAVGIAPAAGDWSRGDKAGNFLGMMFGDSRKLFAGQFFTMADVYFHSGYYPSVFDKNSGEEKEIISQSHGKKETEEEEKNEDFMGQPKDWVDAFGRNFKITKHTHLENHNEREILPWLRLAADLDPNKVDTYTVGAYFLWEHLEQPAEAEAFLREGFRNNPDSTEIIFELGRIYRDAFHDRDRARNLWELGIKKHLALKTQAEVDDDRIVFEEIVVNLAHLEEDAGNLPHALDWFRLAQHVTLNKGVFDEHIAQLEKKLSAQKQP
jgi:tetratricopeptide (TPR) repeat protein